MCDLSDWTDIIAISTGEYHTVGLRSDGTVVAKGKPDADWVKLSDWTDVVAISAGVDMTLGLRADGTVLIAGAPDESTEREIAGLQDVVGINYDMNIYSARKSDGTVVSNYNLADWEDVKQISTSEHGWLVRLMTDGTVRIDAQEDWMLEESSLGKQVDIAGWTDIVFISAGWGHILGVRSDGTVVATGDNASKQSAVDDWADIVAVSSGQTHSVGLKSDGTVVSCGSGVDSKRGIKNWTDIKLPADREKLLSSIRLDYITE
jgi:alpha-tubulin suppressor-like RCC1 family protein